MHVSRPEGVRAAVGWFNGDLAMLAEVRAIEFVLSLVPLPLILIQFDIYPGGYLSLITYSFTPKLPHSRNPALPHSRNPATKSPPSLPLPIVCIGR